MQPQRTAGNRKYTANTALKTSGGFKGGGGAAAPPLLAQFVCQKAAFSE